MAKRYVTITTDADGNPQVKDMKPANPLVSVILPIFNAGLYLHQALDSVQGQTYENLEIICINDGSTDDSLEIIKSHAANDPRIVVVDKANKGYGAGCNRGMDEAHGHWIAILEPDDWWEPSMVADMVDFANSFAQAIDIVKTPYWRISNPDTPDQQKLNCPFKKQISTSKKPFTIEEEPVLLRHHPCIWSALYRRDFLASNAIRFKPIPGAGWADNPFLIETLCKARAIVYLDQAYYCYREETVEKTRNFFTKQPMVPIDRWNEMQDILDELQVTDEGVLRAQVKRAFSYTGGVLEFHSIDEPEIRAAVASVFDRLDPALVFDNEDVSPGQQRLFAELRGIECPSINKAVYVGGLLKTGLHAIRIGGPSAALAGVGRFVNTRKRRSGGK